MQTNFGAFRDFSTKYNEISGEAKFRANLSNFRNVYCLSQNENSRDVTKSGNGERGTGNGERGTGVWERVYSGFPHNNSKWRTHEKKNTDDKCSSICWRRIYFVMLTL